MKNKINNKEFCSLTVILIITKLLFVYPHYIFKIAGGQAWITCLLVTAEMLIIEWILGKIMPACGGLDTIESRPIKLITGILLPLLFACNAALTMKPFEESVSFIIIEDVRINVILFLMLAAAAFGAYCGIVSIARICGMYLPVIIAGLAAVVILLIPQYHLYNMVPREESVNIFLVGSVNISMFADVTAAHMLAGMSRSLEDAKRSIRRAVIISGIIAAVICLSYSMRVNVNEVRAQISPLYQMARLINLGVVLERLESLFEFIWIIGALLYTAAYIAVISIVWSQAFEIKYHRNLIIPAALIVWALMAADIKLHEFVKIASTLYLWVFALELAVLIIAAAGMRKKKN